METEHKLVKTDYGYDYRGVSITRKKSGEFTFDKIWKFNSRPLPMKLRECVADIDNCLDNLGATVERYKIKVGE